MRTGAFFILDCLGFKGVWERAKPADVLDMLAAIERSKESTISDAIPILKEATKLEVSLAFLSDTIVGGISYLTNPSIEVDPADDNPQELRDKAGGGLLILACALANSISHSFLESAVPLSTRGCVSYGEFLMSGNFILGPAVDEAAELSEIAEGAFIWLTPAADRIARPYVKYIGDRIVKTLTTTTWDSIVSLYGCSEGGDLKTFAAANGKLSDEQFATIAAAWAVGGLYPDFLVHDYSMPIKGGAVVRTSLVNPICFGKPGTTSERYARTLDRIRLAMNSDRLDVVVKRQNTEAFLAFARMPCDALEERINALVQAMEAASPKPR